MDKNTKHELILKKLIDLHDDVFNDVWIEAVNYNLRSFVINYFNSMVFNKRRLVNKR